ncbi:hypothetical protein MBM_05278 [Drepanopeziza brunnea f. sp. 'multigermtubi' MB_m1]|uniref:Uncharacterized protein n=1 Tax=Marssonina brunnea f. sp. multigermtubi (strain MB_m1) TaxID=1072389 RepID=K1XVS9_MARBU|nr:uncharacterized protein MBM_05278 [Drepanopeziza brunnea f. sp. 'multigermtubi' MB_m1]EKD16809.1 hypothetical protein MBM_05278 [Drepanopeziza brunnea f. sp. 'multigermtubi' MB_m1]
MVLLSQPICSILLALSLLCNGAYGEMKVIGYRTVNKWEASFINRRGKPYRNKGFDRDYGRYNQIGHGFYLTNEPASWSGPVWVIPWYCVIEADSEKMDQVSKVWVPKSYAKPVRGGKAQPTLLWDWEDENEETILEYIESLKVPDPAKAVRFAWMPKLPGKVQMVIPTDTINNDDLGFRAQCWDSKEGLESYSDTTVDWSSWVIDGDAGDPLPSTDPSSTVAPSTVAPNTVDPNTVDVDTVDPKSRGWHRKLLDCIGGLPCDFSCCW